MLNTPSSRSFPRPSKLSHEVRYEDSFGSSGLDANVTDHRDDDHQNTIDSAVNTDSRLLPQAADPPYLSKHAHTASTVSSTSSISSRQSTSSICGSSTSTSSINTFATAGGNNHIKNSNPVATCESIMTGSSSQMPDCLSASDSYYIQLDPPPRMGSSGPIPPLGTTTLTPPDHVAMNSISGSITSSPSHSEAGYFNTDHHYQNAQYHRHHHEKTGESASVTCTPLCCSNEPHVDSENDDSKLKVPSLGLVRPDMKRFHSLPAYSTLSPTRQHFRLSNMAPREIKETLNAAITDVAGHKIINQYELHEVAGQGSLGLVQVGIDRLTGLKYAVKQFSKSQLRKKRRNEFLHKRKLMPGGRNVAPSLLEQDSTPIDLIRREVAIMKKLDHPNIVSLIEVLDDSQSDNLYMILEWCGKGVILPTTMQPGGPDNGPDGDSPLYTRSPYSDEQCRLYFRDMILGIEYLHSQGIVHRDIKAENVLVSDDDVVKIVDFGVSEMFDKGSANDIYLTNHAGSPAYMAPELLKLRTSGTSSGSRKQRTGGHADDYADHISGRATDMWSMGVVLYYIRFGFLPFVSETLNELYDKIMNDSVRFPADASDDLKDLLCKILEKDPNKRITMPDLRVHPWVTKRGDDELLSTEENCDNITPITEEDIQTAIEHIEGYMDPSEATEQLRKLHGWRGSLISVSNTSSRVSSPGAVPDGPLAAASHNDFVNHDSVSLAKLTRALDEILIKQDKVRLLSSSQDHYQGDSCSSGRRKASPSSLSPSLSASPELPASTSTSSAIQRTISRLPADIDADHFQWTVVERPEATGMSTNGKSLNNSK